MCSKKTKDLNIHVFKRNNESKLLTKDISCECKCKFNGRKCNSIQSGIMANLDASVKNIIYVNKIIFGILLHVVVKIVNIWQLLQTI